MSEWLTSNPDAPVHFDCVELDMAAIEHARVLTSGCSDRVTFFQQNALRYTPTKTYDLIWAAGICDYFTDPIFTRLLKRIVSALSQDGECVVGNFSEGNTTRDYMEMLGEWQLHHRTRQRLQTIAAAAGISSGNTTVGCEPEGINLFLHISGRKMAGRPS